MVAALTTQLVCSAAIVRSARPSGLSRALPLRRRVTLRVANIAAPAEDMLVGQPAVVPPFEGGKRLANAPPFTLQDMRDAIPAECFEKDTFRSAAHLALDVGIVAALAIGAYTIGNPLVWPLYWFLQGTMFWALFVVGHDCGHQSWSNNKTLNDFVGNIVHSSIMVPYHGWRISHRTHHANHGHVENDESWHPTVKSNYEKLDKWAKLGRLLFPFPLFAYPFYLLNRSPGKNGSHYDPKSDLFTASEGPLVETSNKFQCAWIGFLAGCTVALGPLAMLNLYVLPYWVFVVWLDVVTYLHHHGPSDPEEEVPWYRGEEWSYFRGGLSTIDRDYGIFNKLHHDIGTHVVHHLFPQIPHYHLQKATEAVKPIMGDYYREPEKSPGPIPTHLFEPLRRSFARDHFVDNTGDIVFYQQDKNLKL
ncbi:hypothetical protein D9Q98_002075 [Chlorella vulgaris]|uniref:Omega-3 fatty acid desaturase n=1 Tax=Chlorella vulgaris TaxID=3077 RepID=A0A9D4Z0K2_CHLVU|nr:hypothetical protein D9Q98_002075 [Chlorella vulgaris]